jgi:hypothetical protein
MRATAERERGGSLSRLGDVVDELLGRLVFVDRSGLRCSLCGSELCPPAEALELEHGTLAHVSCATDGALSARGE